ncbi:MAG: hypothetical protein IPN69_05125 [Acidobacteria bacterium]|nr:hypothetical protein [Acidobacteriota bacterium]
MKCARTGAEGELKSLVPANGTTLAEQELVTIGSTTTEKLTFIHQDPSLASLQRTDNAGNLVNSNVRAGEYDALGRNVADPGPYVTLNTDPPVGDSGGSGINLDGTAQGYRPGRGNYLVDGLPVPEDYARDLINSGRMGGIFGVVEAAVRISNRRHCFTALLTSNAEVARNRLGSDKSAGEKHDSAICTL